MTDRSRTMLLLDGSLASLIASAMWHEGRLIAGESPAGERASAEVAGTTGFAWLIGTEPMQRAAEAHARAFGLQVVARSDGASDRGIERGSSLVVLAGATAAARLGCASLVWPVHGGSASADVDLDVVAEAIDRATLIGRLASLDSRFEIEVETPFVDLSDRQIADLAIDMGVDAAMCWWAAVGEDHEGAAERRRWQRALREAGVPMASGQG